MLLAVDSLAAAAKPVIVSLVFAGGLLPSLKAANQAAFASLFDAEPALAQPTRGSIGGSAPLRSSPLLAYPVHSQASNSGPIPSVAAAHAVLAPWSQAPLLLDDVLDVVGRFSTADLEAKPASSSLAHLIEGCKQRGKLVRTVATPTLLPTGLLKPHLREAHWACSAADCRLPGPAGVVADATQGHMADRW